MPVLPMLTVVAVVVSYYIPVTLFSSAMLIVLCGNDNAYFS